MESVYGAFERTARRYGGKPFLHSAGLQLCRVPRTGPSRSPPPIAARGYGAGHRVALKLGNRPEFLLHFLALNSLGARHRAAQPRVPGRPSWTTCCSTASLPGGR